jgi:hypothetical protein
MRDSIAVEGESPLRAFFVALAVLMACSACRAGTEIRRSGLEHMLINDVRVQRELKLTEAQCDAVYDLRWRTSGLLGDIIREHMRKKDAVDRRKDEAGEARIASEHAASLAKILSREQFARYEQIRLQYLREEALLEPAVQKGIKLDAGRVEKLASIFYGYLDEYNRRAAESNKLPMREQLRLASKRLLENMAHRDAALKQMGELLTDEQRAAFQALKGPVFRVQGRDQLGSMSQQAFRPR